MKMFRLAVYQLAYKIVYTILRFAAMPRFENAARFCGSASGEVDTCLECCGVWLRAIASFQNGVLLKPKLFLIFNLSKGCCDENSDWVRFGAIPCVITG